MSISEPPYRCDEFLMREFQHHIEDVSWMLGDKQIRQDRVILRMYEAWGYFYKTGVHDPVLEGTWPAKYCEDYIRRALRINRRLKALVLGLLIVAYIVWSIAR